jgi:hydrogenase nickel incorporation protein HypA/HybF
VHELAIAQSIVSIVEESVTLDEGERVRTIEMVAGELTGIVPESLTFCFEFAAKDTVADGARLVIESVPVRGRCRGCGVEFAVEDYNFACNECSSTDIEMTSGRELFVKQVEVE